MHLQLSIEVVRKSVSQNCQLWLESRGGEGLKDARKEHLFSTLLCNLGIWSYVVHFWTFWWNLWHLAVWIIGVVWNMWVLHMSTDRQYWVTFNIFAELVESPRLSLFILETPSYSVSTITLATSLVIFSLEVWASNPSILQLAWSFLRILREFSLHIMWTFRIKRLHLELS